MRIGSRIKTWWQKESTKYAAAGTLLLALAGTALALSLGTGAQAAEITLGEKNLTLEQDSDGAYLIKNAEDLNALRTATEDQTENNTFRLSGDLDFTSITTAATGTFAGTFDGGGHVITIGDININTAKTEPGAAEGVLFGTVTGMVRNLIVDITDPDASYTRESDAGVNVDYTSKSDSHAMPEFDLQNGEPVSELSTGDELTAYNKIHGSYETVYLNQSGEEVNSDSPDAEAYKRYTTYSETTSTSKYLSKSPGSNSFGVICGELQGNISRVSVNGESISVSQSAALSGYDSQSKTTRTPTYFYYKAGTTDKTTSEDFSDGSVSLSAPGSYPISTVSKTAGNQAAENLFTLQVSAPKTVIRETDDRTAKITYTVTVAAVSGTLPSVTVKADGGATAAGGSGNSHTFFDVSTKGQSIDFQYEVSSGVASNVSMKFTASCSVGSPAQTVTASSQVETAVVGGTKTASGKNAAVTAGMMGIQVEETGPSEGNYTYSVTITNNSNANSLKNISIIAPEGAQTSDATTVASIAPGDNSAIEFTSATSITGEFTVTAQVGEPAQTICASAAAGNTGTSAAISAGSLSATVSAASYVSNADGTQIKYTVKVTDDRASGTQTPVVSVNHTGITESGTGSGSWNSTNDTYTYTLNEKVNAEEKLRTSFTVTLEDSDGTERALKTNDLMTTFVDTESKEESPDENEQISSGSLKLEVSAPAALQAEENDTEISILYTIKVTGETGDTVTLTASEEGKWGTSVEDARSATTSEQEYKISLSSGTPATVYYIRTVSYTGSGDPKEMSSVFSATAERTSVTAAVKTGELETTIHPAASLKAEFSGSVVEAELTRDRSFVFEDETDDGITYTLTLTNRAVVPIQMNELAGWDVKEDAGWSTETYILSDGKKIEGRVLEADGSVTLTKSVTSSDSGGETVDLSGIKIVTTEIPTYTYEESKKQTGAPEEPTTRTGDAIYAGNHLYAGILAGSVTGGSIVESRQETDLIASGASLVDNGAGLYAGGVAGKVAGVSPVLSDLYVKGSVSGSNQAVTGLVTGSLDETVRASRIITLHTGTTGMEGTESDSMFSGADAFPEEEWKNWMSFTRYTASEQSENVYDLSWLVKNNEDIFQLTDPSGAETDVTLAVSDPVTDKTLSWQSVYQARRSREDQEMQRYYSDTAAWELGESGYYLPVHVYATDGYYHYVEDFSENTEGTRYPFNKDAKPQFISEDPQAWSVVRETGGLTDWIRLSMDINFDMDEIEVYYGNGSQATEAGYYVYFPFEDAAVSITAVPVWNGKIYEEICSGEFTAKDREPLPEPTVTSSSYFNENGETKEEAFQDGGRYESGSTMNLSGTADGCSYAVYFSDKGPVSDPAGPVWDGENRTVDTETFDRVYGSENAWTECRVSFQIPEELEGPYYLYLKVTRENYPATIYCFGSFTAGAQAASTPVLYYDFADGAGTPITDRQVAEGDTLIFEMEESETLTELEYVISGAQLSGGSLYGAEWKDYSGPVQIPDSEGAASCYIYSRMKSEDGENYGPVTSQEYFYIDRSAGAEASPRTGTVSGTGEVSGASIASGSVVYLESSTQEARILYLVNTSASTKLELQRVNSNTESLTEDGHYFKAGNRWYYTELEGVQVYEEGALVLYNEIDSAQTQYVHTVVIGDNLEPSESISYIYSVQVMGQVAAPESTLPTRYYPGGSEAEIAQVEKDTYLSFTSLTPNAELYYVIGNGTVSDQEDEATGTRKYDSSAGILVDADYGSQFVVSIKAVRWNADHTKKEMRDSETVQFVFEVAEQGLALTPTATPATTAEAPTTVLPGEKILLSTATRGGSVYYTTDGSAPQVIQGTDGSWQAAGNSTKLYDAGTGIAMPEEGTGFFTIRAVAVHPDLGVSPEAQFVYAFPDAVQSPYANIPSGSVDEGTEIILRNRTEGATIYYTVGHNGENPADPTISSTVFEESQPIIVEGKTVVKAIAVKDGVKSEIITFTYGTMKQLSAPEASIASGSMVSRGTRLTLSAAEGASIYYTTDGSDPLASDNSAVIAGDSLILDGTAGAQVTVKAYARKDGSSASEVVTFTYQISQSVSGVTADVASGSQVSNGSKVNLMTDVTGAVIYYTTDGSDPAENGVEGTVVTINGTAGSTYTIKAVAVVNGEAGTAATFTYRIKEKPTAPGASPSGGVLTVAVRVTLSSSAEKIYYTTDGTTPTESSTLYTEPVLINRTTELKAISVSEDGETSDVSTFQYTAAQKASAPTASMEDGSVLDPGTVLSLSTETSGAEIYYSTDGTEPTLDNLENLLQFNGDGITVNRTVTVKAVAYREDLQLSDVSEYNYTVETIPAVEQKRAEEERLAEQGLHDTDASALERNQDYDSVAYGSRVLKEDEYHTVVLSSGDSIPDRAVLVTEEKEYSQKALENVKQVFGETYTILNSYEIYLMQGGAIIQPDGPVEIGVPIPAEYENAAVTLIRIEEENKLTRLETRRKDGMVYAEVEHFSHYALVGVADPENAGEPFDYLLILEAAAGLSVILGMGYLIRQRWKKYRNSR